MSITLREIESVLTLPRDAVASALIDIVARERAAAGRKAPGKPTGKGHALCVHHEPMPDNTTLTGKWLCWAGKPPTAADVKARIAFVAQVEKSALLARRRWQARPAPDGKLAWLDGKRVRPSGLIAARAKIVDAREEAGKYAPTGVQPGDCFDTARPERPRGYRPGVGGFRSKLESTRRRSRKTVIRVTARA